MRSRRKGESLISSTLTTTYESIPGRLSPSDRFRSLDGLRGVAALTVVFYHLSLVLPQMAAADSSPVPTSVPFSLTWLANYSPLRVFTAGPEIVVVFFILSGFVLSLGPLRNRQFDWMSYVPRRLIRLYLPVVAALLFSVAVIALVPRTIPNADNLWLSDAFRPPIDIGSIVDDATILFGAPFDIDGVMWSLVPEVWFSLLLPVFVALTLLFRRFWWVGIFVSLVVFSGGNTLYPGYLGHLPTFFIGCCVALGLPDIRRVADRISALRSGWVLWSLLLVLSAVLIPFDRTLRALIGPSPFQVVVGSLLATFGALLLVLVAIGWSRARWALELPPIRWLGRVSFSLYLVHLPIVLAVAFLIGDTHARLVALIALPACLIVAELFFRGVERPAHLLSQYVGRRIASSRAG